MTTLAMRTSRRLGGDGDSGCDARVTRCHDGTKMMMTTMTAMSIWHDMAEM